MACGLRGGARGWRGREVPEDTYTFNPECNRIGNDDYKRYVRQPELWRDVANLRVGQNIYTFVRWCSRAMQEVVQVIVTLDECLTAVQLAFAAVKGTLETSVKAWRGYKEGSQAYA